MVWILIKWFADDRWVVLKLSVIFSTRCCIGICILFRCFTCLRTYNHRQLSLAGAQQSADGAVEQLVVMEADVTGIWANHHWVFLRHQLQIARPFLRQKWTKTAVSRSVVRDQRGLVWTGTGNIQEHHSSFNPHIHADTYTLLYIHTHRHTHRNQAVAGLSRSCHAEEASRKLIHSGLEFSLKQQTFPLPLSHGQGSFYKQTRWQSSLSLPKITFSGPYTGACWNKQHGPFLSIQHSLVSIQDSLLTPSPRLINYMCSSVYVKTETNKKTVVLLFVFCGTGGSFLESDYLL